MNVRTDETNIIVNQRTNHKHIDRLSHVVLLRVSQVRVSISLLLTMYSGLTCSTLVSRGILG